MSKLLESALWYANKGYSIIPVSHNKKPLIKWQRYQTEKADAEQIQEWWSKNPNANIGIVTGKISGLTVIDLDSQEAIDKIESMWPESFSTPIATSPRGGQHRYFKYNPEIHTVAGILPETDIRSDGGFIIAPPSQNGKGCYKWNSNLSIANAVVNNIPNNIIKHLRTNSTNNIYKGTDSKRQQQTGLGFSKGRRDNDLFHVANCLVKGGMEAENIQGLLTLIASNICTPPYPQKEIPIKIKSAFDRIGRQQRNWKADIVDMLRQQSGIITTATVHNWQQVTARNEKKVVNDVLARLAKEGKLIKKTGVRAGEYRIISDTFEKKDWKNATNSSLDIVLPLGLHECVKVRPGSILCFAAKPNVAKTAMAMDLARNNCHNGTVNYFSSETDESEFNERAVARGDLDRWKVDFIDNWMSHDIQDIVDPDKINIIDYLEPPNGDFTQMAIKLTEIHHNLKSGIAVVFIQIRGDGDGVGGAGMQEKPQLYCKMEVSNFPVVELKVIKCKGMNYGYKNPYGKYASFKVNTRNGCELTPITPFNFERWRD